MRRPGQAERDAAACRTWPACLGGSPAKIVAGRQSRLHLVVFDDAGFAVGQLNGRRGRLLEPHPGAAAILSDELDAGCLQRGAHLVDTADASVLATFKTVDSIPPNTGRFDSEKSGGREWESNPPKTGSLPHSDLKSERPTRDDSLPGSLGTSCDGCINGPNKSRRCLFARRSPPRLSVTP
jgi:hypothetical protein